MYHTTIFIYWLYNKMWVEWVNGICGRLVQNRKSELRHLLEEYEKWKMGHLLEEYEKWKMRHLFIPIICSLRPTLMGHIFFSVRPMEMVHTHLCQFFSHSLLLYHYGPHHPLYNLNYIFFFFLFYQLSIQTRNNPKWPIFTYRWSINLFSNFFIQV